MFTHVAAQYPDLKIKRVDIDGRRHYVTPTGKKYPSITTILAANPEKLKVLEDWKKRVGKEEATKISTRATRRGTKLHSIIENYLKNQPVEMDPDDAIRFRDFKEVLNPISNIHIQESYLFSDRLRIAGSPDCIAEYGGVLSVIDFKTAMKPKKREWISDYFKQSTFYACAAYEQFQIKPTQVVILIAVEDDSPQVFIEPVSKWIKPLIEARDNYERKQI